jgi:hypothetical protein
MRVQVERCWGANNNYFFRLTFKNGEREYVRGDEWTRAVATEALNIAENLYGLKRKNVKFDRK